MKNRLEMVLGTERMFYNTARQRMGLRIEALVSDNERDLPMISTPNLNTQNLLAMYGFSHKLRKFVKDSEYAFTHKKILQKIYVHAYTKDPDPLVRETTAGLAVQLGLGQQEFFLQKIVNTTDPEVTTYEVIPGVHPSYKYN